MTSGPLETYLEELRRALGDRGHDDPRIVDEAREHLADAVEDSVRRGLDRAEAEREAIARFGPPDVVAAHTPPPRSRIMSRLTTAFDTIVGHWRWIAAATAIAALVTSVASSYLLPTRYRSYIVIAIVQQATPPWAWRPSPEQADASRARLNAISRAILSTSRLDWIARDFGLHKQADSPGDAVLRMRRNLGLALQGAGQEIVVSYESSDPMLAMRITKRIAELFIEENLRDRDALAFATTYSIDAEVDDARVRLRELELKLEALKATQQNGLLRADLIPFEVMQERYRTLLVRREEARTTANLERRGAIGEQFRMLEGPRVPEQPVGPSRASVNIAGALAGLMFSTVGLIWRRPS